MAINETVDGETVDVSAGAKAVIARAVEELRPFSGEPRVAALQNKLEQIARPVSKADRLADTLTKVDVAKMEVQAAGGLGPDDLVGREKMAKATRDAQAAYLREMSPGAAAALDREREFDEIRQGGQAA